MEKRLPLPIGTLLHGRYRIRRQLGHGGFGSVYEAVDDDINLSFALKQTFYAENPELREAFKREARILASLSHDAFPRVFHYFTQDDGCFLVMELVRGEDLDRLLKEQPGPFKNSQVLSWAEQILDALGDLHTNGIIHRDIKPANLKLTPKGKIKLLDFGIAKGFLEGDPATASTIGSLAAGTLQYAPLEQVLKASENYQVMLSVINPDAVLSVMKRGTGPDSDLYALAATIYQLLTKKLPADAATRALAVWSHQKDPLIPADQLNADVPSALSLAISQAMEMTREKRFASAMEMREALIHSLTSDDNPIDVLPSELDHVSDKFGEQTLAFSAENYSTVPGTNRSLREGQTVLTGFELQPPEEVEQADAWSSHISVHSEPKSEENSLHLQEPYNTHTPPSFQQINNYRDTFAPLLKSPRIISLTAGSVFLIVLLGTVFNFLQNSNQTPSEIPVSPQNNLDLSQLTSDAAQAAQNGNILKQQNRIKAADKEFVRSEQLYRRAVMMDPSNAQLRVSLASVYIYREKWADAAEEYREALQHDPNNEEYKNSLKQLEARKK